MNVPGWWTWLLLVGASYRIWRLAAVDEITVPLRDWVTRVDEYHRGRPENYRAKLDELIGCPWCLGFWIVFAWWGLWQLWPTGVEVASVPFAVSTAVGLVARFDQ